MTWAIEAEITASEINAAHANVRRAMRGLVVGLLAVVAISGGVGAAIGALVVGVGHVALLGGWSAAAALVVGAPFVVVAGGISKRRGIAIGMENARHAHVLRLEAARREFETRLARGLEMADDEEGAFDVIRRSVAATLPDTTMELLLADNSHAHFVRAVAVSPDDGLPIGCAVESPEHCVATRRAHRLVFVDGDALDACPKLRGRGVSPCTGVCVPVSVMGRTVGVAHAVRDAQRRFSDEEVQALQSIANQAGNRLGVIRMMAESQLQASTDGLTGLTNRRSFENRLRRLRAEGVRFTFVMADLDHFKDLNDTYGHEAGDRALRVFARVLRESLRSNDIACRYGGEEFAVLLPGTDVPEAIEVVQRLRVALSSAASLGDAPKFTASFGIAHSGDAADLEDLLHRADRALFAAKDAGRDCACLDGHREPVASVVAFG